MILTPADELQRERAAVIGAIRESLEQVTYWKMKKASAWRPDHIQYAAVRLLAWQMNLKVKRARLVEIGGAPRMEVAA